MTNSIFTGKHYIEQIKNMQNSSEIVLNSEKDRNVIIHTNLSYKKNPASPLLINKAAVQWEVGEELVEYMSPLSSMYDFPIFNYYPTTQYKEGLERCTAKILFQGIKEWMLPMIRVYHYTEVTPDHPTTYWSNSDDFNYMWELVQDVNYRLWLHFSSYFMNGKPDEAFINIGIVFHNDREYTTI